MLLTPHILTGVAIVTKVPNPILGLLLVLLSHYFIDCFPHWEYSIENIKGRRWGESLLEFLKIFFDFSFGVLLVLFLSENNPFVLAAVFLAVLPDGLSLLYAVFRKNKILIKHQRWHVYIHTLSKNKRLPAYWGIVSQIAVMALAIFFLL